MEFNACIVPSVRYGVGMETQNSKVHVTLENVIALAKAIVSKHGIEWQAAMDLAEFNLNFSASYSEAATRV